MDDAGFLRRAYLEEELHRLLVCSAVKRTLERGKAGCDRRVDVGLRRGDDPDGEGRGV